MTPQERTQQSIQRGAASGGICVLEARIFVQAVPSIAARFGGPAMVD
jgi:hypothetical protein